jgi:hypothetical protein
MVQCKQRTNGRVDRRVPQKFIPESVANNTFRVDTQQTSRSTQPLAGSPPPTTGAHRLCMQLPLRRHTQMCPGMKTHT